MKSTKILSKSYSLLSIRHSLRLNAELAARAWLILGSLVVGVQIILRVFILVFLSTFYETYKNTFLVCHLIFIAFGNVRLF